MDAKDVLIIGAGISGLLCATELKRRGLSVCVVDKGRGVGGRMSTRTMDVARWDHGAQFFTVRDERFQSYADEWLEAGVITEWFRHADWDNNPEGYPRYRGMLGMTDAPKYLAKDLNIHSSEQIIEISRVSDRWVVRAQSGTIFSAKHLIITVPLPQALGLLETSGLNFRSADMQALSAIHYEKGLATLAILDGPSGLGEHGGQKLHDGPLTWIADNQMKGIATDAATVTIHANAKFAETHWDSPDELRGRLMLEAAAPYLKAKAVDFHCHRWGFTMPLSKWPTPYYHNAGLKLTLAGDAFGGTRVEGAAISGIEAATTVLSE